MLYNSASDLSALTLVEVLQWRATHQATEIAYRFVHNGDTEDALVTYAELDRRARAIGASLQELRAGGRPALLLYPPGLEYIAAFFGCLYAGTIAVPVYPPRLNRHLLRLQSILTDAQAAVALTDARSLARLRPLLNRLPELEAIRWVATDLIPDRVEDEWREPDPDHDSLALLQYTSGSTSVPRGVMLSHRNLIHNSMLLAQAFGYTAESRCVSWLPVYHDMGLIGGVVQPLYGGFPCVLMPPASFLQRPVRWLQTISRYQATLSGAPNFAYDLCVRSVTAEQRSTLDLSSWTVAFNGAEPIREETLRRFAQAFEPCGFRPQTFFPCYGLAEATLMVSGGPNTALPVIQTVDARSLERGRVAETTPDVEGTRSLVGSGKLSSCERAIVVSPETLTECPRDEVGEIWLSSDSVARGYWNRPEETASTFRAHLADTGEGPFLRTGDLGFITGDELFITGRLKDLIIIRGRNHYPQDIELTVEQSHPALRPACGAACSVEIAGDEKLVIVQEVEHRRQPDLDGAVNRIRQSVAEEHELQPYAVVLLRPGSIPKTSSGKIQRHACRAAFLTNSLDALAEWRAPLTPEVETPALIPKPISSNKEEIETYLVLHLASSCGLDAAEIDTSQSITDFGLDSLGAIALSHRIESGLGIVLPILRLLEGDSISELAADLASRLRESGNDLGPVLLPSMEEHSSYPLSHGQSALWFLQQAAPESAAYNVASALRIRGDLSRRALRESFQQLVDRHPSLRTSFTVTNGEPSQTVHLQMSLDFIEEDAADWSLANLYDHLNQEAHRPFDLEHEPLMRIRLFIRSSGEHVVLLVAHHIAVDFWSLGILMRELMTIYEAKKSGSEAALEPLELQYVDYVRWQGETLASREGERLWSYWERQLAGDTRLLDLPVDYPRPPIQTYRGASIPFRFSAELTQRLRSLARKQGATLYMVLLAAYQTLLYRYTNQDTIVVGSSAACRSRAGLAGVVGYFVNSLVLRGDLSGDPTFTSFLAGVRQTVLEAFEYQDYPFSLLVERLQPVRDPSRSPLFQAMFVLNKAQRPAEDYLSQFALGDAAAKTKMDGLELESIPLEQRTSQFELTLVMAEMEDKLGGALQYNTDLFAAETIKRMSDHYLALLEAIVANPKQHLSELPLLTTAERQQLLVKWNDTKQEYPAGQCIHQLFEQQVERTPDSIALVYEEEKLRYRELNERANQLARRLRRLGVGVESLVGVLMERSVEMVVSLLAILKAGAAYVPLDPEYPRERRSLMMDDAGVSIILTQDQLSSRVGVEDSRQIVRVDREWAEIAFESSENVASGVTSDNLIYVIYTSGSTGIPKGVMLPHRGIVNCLWWLQSTFQLGAQDRVMLKASLSFDASVWELFWPLLVGARVIVARAGGHRDAAYLKQAIIRHGVTTMHSVPSMLSVMLNEKGLSETPSLKRLLCGGEAMPLETLDRFYAQATAELHNFYGPTETSIGSTDWLCKPLDRRTVVPIGSPIANTQVYLLDPNLQPVPVGVAGHLHIGGAGLARGYLKQPALTADRFIPDPFITEPGARLYKTGDLARYLSSGEIEFLGRTDQQVKVRGYRIEPGEVESVLRQHAAVADAIVLTRSVNNRAPQLIAYVLANAGAKIIGIELRRHVKTKLPDYMIPQAFVRLEKIPLMPNGKVDYKALPPPTQDEELSQASYVAPRTPTEEVLSGVFAQVLGVARVGISDSFFELGGHSLLAAQVISRVRALFAIELPLLSLFEAPTVASLGEEIETALREQRGESVAPILPVGRDRALPLSFAQQRLWFVDQLEPNSVLYNIPAAIRLTGPLNIPALEQSLSEIIRRHEALRTTFTGVAGQPVQIIHPAEPLRLQVEDLGDLGEETRWEEVRRHFTRQAQQSFDLTRGPLMRVRLLRLSEDEHVLLCVMHHIIADGWSMGVLAGEMAALYTAYSAGRVSPLTELSIQYADYAIWQRELLQGKVLDRELIYWKRQLDGVPAVLELVTDYPRPAVQTFNGAHFHFTLKPELVAGLGELSRQEGVTLFMLLVSAFSVLLSRHSGQEDLVIGTPVAGRTHEETEGLIGFFINSVALRIDVAGEPSFRELLQRVRDVCLGAYAHQELPFEKLVEFTKYNRNANYHPIFQVACALQDDSLPSLRLPGLNASLLEMDHNVVRYDLRLNVLRTPDKISCSFEYKTDLFHASTIARMAEHFQILLELVVTQADTKLNELADLLTAEERNKESHYQRELAEAGARKLKAIKRKAVREFI